MEEESQQIDVFSTSNKLCGLCLNQIEFKNLQNLNCDFIFIFRKFFEAMLGYDLPDNVCLVCFEELTRMVSFIKQCKQLHDTLNEECKIGESEVKVVIVGDVQGESTGSLDVPLVPKTIVKEKVCPKCGEVVVKLLAHYKRSSTCRPRNIKCGECPKRFISSARLRSHTVACHWKSTHHPFRCNMCPKMFKYNKNLMQHVKIQHFNQFHLCDLCGKGYKSEPLLKDHMNSHTGIKPYQCSYCGKGFTGRSLCSAHEKLHSTDHSITQYQDGKVKCPVCQKQFAHARALSLHKIVHNPNRTFKCSLCKRDFATGAQLHKHSATHDHEKRHVCHCCNKSFKNAACLKTHLRKHTGERPFACTECPKRFTQLTHLSNHKLLHTGEKSFTCFVCNKNFRFKGNLTAHMRIHTGEKPYFCDICKKAFRTSSQQKTHFKLLHQQQDKPVIPVFDGKEATVEC